MKRQVLQFLIIIPVVCICYYSCKKDDKPPTPDQVVSHIVTSVSIHDIANHRLHIDSFERDASTRLAKFVSVYEDSTQSPVTPYVTEYIFSYNGNDTLPAGYSLGNSDHYLVRYDNTGRIVWDSSITIQNTYYFTYSSNVIGLDQYFPPNIGHYTDTMNLTNGNISTRISHFYAPTYIKTDTYTYTYSTLESPFHFPIAIADLIFHMGVLQDYISQKLYTFAQMGNGTTEQVNWILDSHGRVIRGNKTLTISGTAYPQIITINYMP